MRTAYALIGFGIMLMLVAASAMSNPILPYDPGGTQNIPSALARLSEVGCVHTADGYVFTFSVEVFQTAWAPVYRINLAEAAEAVIRPAGCPSGWSFVGGTPYLTSLETSFEPMSFGTTSDPILPGGTLRGFAVLSKSSLVEFRWFPASENGTLIGKVTRERFEGPLETDQSTWGSIKAMYR